MSCRGLVVPVPVGAGYSATSCDLRVLMDQPTNSISPHDPPHRHNHRWFVGSKWRCLSQGAVGTVDVVMSGVLGQHQLQLSTSEDEHPVEQLASNAAVNLASRSRITNRNRPTSSRRVMTRFRACCVTHSPTGCGVTPNT